MPRTSSWKGGFLALAAWAAVSVSAAVAQPTGASTDPLRLEFVPGEILVQFPPTLPRADIERSIAERGATIRGKGAFGAYLRIGVPQGSEFRMARVFVDNDKAQWATPNFFAYAHGAAASLGDGPPDDPLFADQIHLALINILQAWEQQVGDDSVVVGVLDTGIAYEDRPIPPAELGKVLQPPETPAPNTDYLRAPDLAQTSFLPGFDFVNDDPFANDNHFHGTFVAGTIAQSTDNGLGGAGIAPGVTLMPIKVLSSRGLGTLGGIMDGINFATTAGVDVLNMSVGFSPLVSLPLFDFFFVGLDNALQDAYDTGVVLVASSGNARIGIVSRPALNPHVIAVGATNFDGTTRAFYSQHSLIEFLFGIPPAPGLPGNIELVAPVGDGEDRNSDGLPDGVLQQTFAERDPDEFIFLTAAGTSFSAPQVAAVAALLIADGRRGPKSPAGVDTIRQILRESAQDLGFPGPDLIFGAGQLDAAAALE